VSAFVESQSRTAVARSAAARLAFAAERPVATTFVVALVLRVALAVVVAIGWDGTLFLDDANYSAVAQAAADGRLHALGTSFEVLYTRTWTLLGPIAGLYDVFGPVTLLGQLYVALLGAANAALVARLALEVLPARWALVAGIVAATLPSQVLWSSLILKDAAVWALLAGLAVTAAVAANATGRRLATLALVAAVLLFLVGYLRRHTLEIACVALLLAMLVSARRQRLVRVAGAAVLLLCIPVTAGMGVAGVGFLQDSRDPALQRSLNARGNSKVTSAERPDAPAKSVTGQLEYLPKGVSVIAVRPWPWEQSGASIGMTLARAETVLWYPLLLFAAIGLSTAWAHRRVLAFPILVAGVLVVTYGLTEGNLGTAYRHRGEVVWVVVLLAVLGMERVWRWRRRGLAAAGSEAHVPGEARVPPAVGARA
jgi:hypothetical protein